MAFDVILNLPAIKVLLSAVEMLPVTLTLEPVITPPTTDAAVVVPVTEVEVPVITPPTTDAAVTAPVALINPAVRRLPPCTFPVTLNDDNVPTLVMLVCAAVVIAPTKLAPVTAPETDTLLPVITPPTTDAAVVVPVTLVEVPVITPPTTDAAVTAPVALIKPAVRKLPPCTLPVAVTKVSIVMLP